MNELEQLKEKLEKLEGGLRTLLESSRIELDIARELQKLLMRNRTPEVPGLTVFGRFIPSGDLSSESFDILTTKDAKQLWITASSTESFGLSSLLLQSLVHLQSRALVESRPGLSSADVFNDLSLALVQAKKAGHYRLLVARLDPATLLVEGTSVGMAPLLRRAPVRHAYQDFELIQDEAFRQQPDLLEPAHSSAPRLASDAYAFSFHLTPGSRLFYLNSSWRMPKTVGEFLAPLKSTSGPEKRDSLLLEDLNSLLMRAQNHMKASGTKGDLASIAIEVDARKLHLA